MNVKKLQGVYMVLCWRNIFFKKKKVSQTKLTASVQKKKKRIKTHTQVYIIEHPLMFVCLFYIYLVNAQAQSACWTTW